MKYFLLIMAFIVPASSIAQYRGGGNDGNAILQAKGFQNTLPEIYTGGPNDGHSSVSIFNQNALPGIYSGGSNDGFAFQQPRGAQNVLPDIYTGGANDGVSSFGIAAQNPLPGIYAGGANDGFASALVAGVNATPPIYLGGTNDGVDMAGVESPQNALPDIYTGGGNDGAPDDGYSFTVSLYQNSTEPPVREHHERTIPLLQLTGEWFNDDAILGWRTGVETDLDHLELERSEDAGGHFMSIVTLHPNTKDGSQHDYRYSDVRAYHLSPDYLLYRLKCVDKNGGFRHSPIVKLAKDKTAPVIVAYPNPNSGRFTLAILNVNDVSGYSYVLSSVDGKVIKKGNIQDVSTSFDLSGYASASYHLFLFKEGKSVQHFTIILTH